ncbi:MAG TPA: nitrous oxide reductase accessory protein NosL [Candidatus Babeliaceae bacterium]|nr:nitrous oxide reductase accessory protein NosL [Candidatus Babeliaceae bacterium]
MFRQANILFLAAIMASCSMTPQPIQYGKDACDFCRMTIMDPKFGGELITKKGKVFKFDSEECLVNYYKINSAHQGDFRSILVADFSHPGKMLVADHAVFLQDESIGSPMGAHLAAFPTDTVASIYRVSPHARILSWDSLIN